MRLRYGIQAILISVLFCTSASGQFTQGTRDRDPDLDASKQIAADLQKANYHWGPVYLMSRFRIADVGYTEQYYVPSEDQEGGITVAVEAPQRLYFVPRKKVILSAAFTPGVSYSSAANPATQFNYGIRGDAHFLLNHLYLDFYGSRTNSLRSQVGDINRLNTLKEDEVGVAGEAKYSSRTSGQFAVRLRDISYPDGRLQPNPITSPVALFNHQERVARAALLHKTFPLTSLTLAAEATEFDWDRTTFKNGRRTWFGPGFAYDNGRIQFRGEAGPGRLRFDTPNQHEFEGTLGRLGLNYRRGRWSSTASLVRDLGQTLFADNNFYIADQGSLTLSHATTRRVTLRTYFLGERAKYPVPVQGHHRRDEVSFTAVGFDYALRRFGLGLDVGYYERTSTFGGDEDSGIRYIVHVSYSP